MRSFGICNALCMPRSFWREPQHCGVPALAPSTPALLSSQQALTSCMVSNMIAEEKDITDSDEDVPTAVQITVDDDALLPSLEGIESGQAGEDCETANTVPVTVITGCLGAGK